MTDFPKGMKQVDRSKLEVLLQSLPLLAKSGMELEQITEHYGSMITEIETSSKCRVSLEMKDEDIVLNVVDLGGDYIRSRPTSKALNLRARKQGVPLVVTLVEDDKDVSLPNKQVVAGLRELADYIESMPVEMKDVGKADWPHTLGSMPVNTETDLDELEAEDDEQDMVDETTEDVAVESAPEETAIADENIPDASPQDVLPSSPSDSVQSELPPEKGTASGGLSLGGESL
jgi:hypothetical protein